MPNNNPSAYLRTIIVVDHIITSNKVFDCSR